MAKAVDILAGDGQYIRGHFSRPSDIIMESIDRLLVIMVHGFPSDAQAHGEMFRDLEALLFDKEYHALRFNFRGCGNSDGNQEDFTFDTAARDFETIIDWAKDHGYERFIVVCEGIGAAIALKNPIETMACMVMLWPMIDLPKVAKTTFKADAIEPEWKKAGYALIDEHRIGMPFIESLEKTDLLPLVRGFKKPLMIMHGAQDKTSPISQLELIRNHIQSRRVEITTFHDGEYGLPAKNHRKTMFYHVMQFIEKYT